MMKALRWLAFPLLLLIAWELASAVGWLRPFSFPPPSRLGAALVELAVSGFPQGEHLWVHVGMTLVRVLQGCVLAILVAIPLGILIGSVVVLDKLTLPIITFARSVASLSLLPLAIIWFGTGELSKVLLIAYGCFWTMLPNAIAAVKYVDPVLIRAARTLDTPAMGVFSAGRAACRPTTHVRRGAGRDRCWLHDHRRRRDDWYHSGPGRADHGGSHLLSQRHHHRGAWC